MRFSRLGLENEEIEELEVQSELLNELEQIRLGREKIISEVLVQNMKMNWMKIQELKMKLMSLVASNTV